MQQYGLFRATEIFDRAETQRQHIDGIAYKGFSYKGELSGIAQERQVCEQTNGKLYKYVGKAGRNTAGKQSVKLIYTISES